jgi:hypothetical protein
LKSKENLLSTLINKVAQNHSTSINFFSQFTSANFTLANLFHPIYFSQSSSANLLSANLFQPIYLSQFYFREFTLANFLLEEKKIRKFFAF